MSEEAELKNMIKYVRSLKEEVGSKTQMLKKLKTELRTFMIDSGIKKYDGVEVRRVISFDLELFRLELPLIFEAYCKREKITTFKNSITPGNKKRFVEKYPDIYKGFIEEKTARLMGL